MEIPCHLKDLEQPSIGVGSSQPVLHGEVKAGAPKKHLLVNLQVQSCKASLCPYAPVQQP